MEKVSEASVGTNLKRIGRCLRCGSCCQGHKLIRGVNRTFLKDSGVLMGMQPDYIERMLNALDTFVCPNLQYEQKNGKKLAVCTQYEHRPSFCREHPGTPADIITQECGFRFVEV